MRKLGILITIVLLLSIFNSCQKDEFSETLPIKEQSERLIFREGQMILGDKLENPYSVENMKKAYENLQSTGSLKSAIKIKTTHYYVRFRPKSEQELEMLKRDTSLIIYDYPLDVEIKKGGTHYHDPSIPAKEITWQYTVVPFDYEFSKVQYQKLAKLYLNEESKLHEKLKGADINYFDWLKLETEALRITNNLDTDENEEKLKSTSWRPAGTIRVFDDVINSYSTTIKVFDHWEIYECPEEDPENPESNVGDDPEGFPSDSEICQRAVYRYETNTINSHFVPIEGVEVRARRWFTTHKGYTDVNGNFSCDGTFKRDANYSIKWERYDFDIRDGLILQAYYNGPKQTGDWNLNIEEGLTPKSFVFAHIFRGAYTYYYKHNQWGIKSPPERDGIFGFLSQRLHIAGFTGSGQSIYLSFLNFINGPQVLVYKNSQNSQHIFGTTIHELAHASHWEIGYSTGQYIVEQIFGDPYVPESWAVGVEAVITNDVYNTSSYNTRQNLTISQMTTGKLAGYTCIVWDLMDDHQQGNSIWYYPIDNVSGYTLHQIENALPGALGSWWNWRTELKDLYNNPTEEHLDALFQSFK